MRTWWVGAFSLSFALACDDGGPGPGELISSGGPQPDDSTSSSGAPATTSTPGTDTTPGQTTDPTTGVTTEPQSTTSSHDDTESGDETTGVPSDPCRSTKTTNITQSGNVSASSEFSSLFGPTYAAELSIDGNIATSWFSAGPNEDGTESSYEWYTQLEHCIDGIGIISNAMHANPDFHEGFGFEAGTIEIIDSSGATVYSQDIDLSGSPDPDTMVEPGGVLGNRIILHMREHESDDCGGFSELVIDGRPMR